jgi:hypothetical protein
MRPEAEAKTIVLLRSAVSVDEIWGDVNTNRDSRETPMMTFKRIPNARVSVATEKRSECWQLCISVSVPIRSERTEKQRTLTRTAYVKPYHHSDERGKSLLPWLHHYNYHRTYFGFEKTPISRLALNNLLSHDI